VRGKKNDSWRGGGKRTHQHERMKRLVLIGAVGAWLPATTPVTMVNRITTSEGRREISLPYWHHRLPSPTAPIRGWASPHSASPARTELYVSSLILAWMCSGDRCFA
jgi:hypothetical protein